MATRIRAQRPHTTEETAPIEESQSVVSSLAELAQDWLDEIDDVLQENAEDFVREYIQKGGE